ncbi:hypothetical protein AB1N83_002830 [Pleurotus pulmonarius]
MHNYERMEGAQELMVSIASFFVGMLSIQCWNYFRSDKNDGIIVRSLVAVLWTLEVAGMACRWLGFYAGAGSQRQRQDNQDPAFVLAPGILNSFTGPLVQAYYIFRIFRLSSSRAAPYLCWLATFASFAIQLATSIGLTQTKSVNVQWKLRWDSWYIASMALSAGIDLTITAILCYLLYRRKDPDQTTRCGKLLDQLIVWTIQTGLITSIFACAGLVVFVAAWNSYSWIYLTGILSRLYPMTMLATLNARPMFQQTADDSMTVNIATGMAIRVSPREWAHGQSFLAPQATGASPPPENEVVTLKEQLGA